MIDNASHSSCLAEVRAATNLGWCKCRWTKFLQKFLSGLCKHLMKRLQFENSKRDDGSNDRPLRASMGPELQRRLAKVILRMADKAQFSKVRHYYVT